MLSLSLSLSYTHINTYQSPGVRLRADQVLRRGSKTLSRGQSATELPEEFEFKVSTPDQEVKVRRAPDLQTSTPRDRGQNTLIGYEAMKPGVPSRRGFVLADLPGIIPDRSTPMVPKAPNTTVALNASTPERLKEELWPAHPKSMLQNIELPSEFLEAEGKLTHPAIASFLRRTFLVFCAIDTHTRQSTYSTTTKQVQNRERERLLELIYATLKIS